MRPMPIVLAVLALLAAPPGRAQAPEELRNWFDDPFVQISAGIAACPLPAGPFGDARDRRAQLHSRAEKGTTCWLAGDCERPNSFAYDRDIAAAAQAALLREPARFADTSLWLTVQGRVLYIEGCVARPAQVAELEAIGRGLPYVQQAIAIVRVGPAASVPYRLRGDAASAAAH